jgi:hypothetical protein
MTQNMVTPLATSLLHFQLKKMLRNMVCILGLFGLATVLATFQKILGDFFPNHLVTLIGTALTGPSINSGFLGFPGGGHQPDYRFLQLRTLLRHLLQVLGAGQGPRPLHRQGGPGQAQ